MHNRISISYAITVCNEHEELRRLLTQLNKIAQPEDQIVIQVDHFKHTQEVNNVIEDFKDVFEVRGIEFVKLNCSLNDENDRPNFAKFKNNLLSWCKRDWIVNLDADELLGEDLAKYIKYFIEDHLDVECIILPRWNIVHDITGEYVDKMNWSVMRGPTTNDYIINWPDWQSRIFVNNPEIRYEGNVHEKLVGYSTYALSDPRANNNEIDVDFDKKLDYIKNWSIIHEKTFEKQKQQNEFYETIEN